MLALSILLCHSWRCFTLRQSRATKNLNWFSHSLLFVSINPRKPLTWSFPVFWLLILTIQRAVATELFLLWRASWKMISIFTEMLYFQRDHLFYTLHLPMYDWEISLEILYVKNRTMLPFLFVAKAEILFAPKELFWLVHWQPPIALAEMWNSLDNRFPTSWTFRWRIERKESPIGNDIESPQIASQSMIVGQEQNCYSVTSTLVYRNLPCCCSPVNKFRIVEPTLSTNARAFQFLKFAGILDTLSARVQFEGDRKIQDENR